MDIEVVAADLPELESEMREVMERRKADIQAGELDGRHWFTALMLQARDNLRRKREFRRR
jgi:hypothetical protein